MTVQLTKLLADRGLRPVDLANACDVQKSTVTRWVEHGVPLVRVHQVEEKTGIPKEVLRPDFFRPEEAAQ